MVVRVVLLIFNQRQILRNLNGGFSFLGNHLFGSLFSSFNLGLNILRLFGLRLFGGFNDLLNLFLFSLDFGFNLLLGQLVHLVHLHFVLTSFFCAYKFNFIKILQNKLIALNQVFSLITLSADIVVKNYTVNTEKSRAHVPGLFSEIRIQRIPEFPTHSLKVHFGSDELRILIKIFNRRFRLSHKVKGLRFGISRN